MRHPNGLKVTKRKKLFSMSVHKNTTKYKLQMIIGEIVSSQFEKFSKCILNFSFQKLFAPDVNQNLTDFILVFLTNDINFMY